MNRELLAELAEAHAPSGHESAVREIVARELAAITDRIEHDPLGGVAGIRDGDGTTLMLAAHMDEIGLMVTNVDEKTGFVSFIALGGWDPRTLVAQRVRIAGREPVDGIVGTTPVHLLTKEARTKTPALTDLAVDTGLPGGRVAELVRPGDTITRVRELRHLGELVTGKALDDRVGVVVMIEAVRAAGPSSAEVWATGTVQEEVGLRGARVAASRGRPDVAVAIDTCPANDGPGAPAGGATTKLGEGTAIRVMDASAIGAPSLVRLLTDLAEEREIPHQFHIADRGGTDTGSLQLSGEGAIAGCISIPTRYVHSSVEACHPDDVDASIRLTAALIEEVDRLTA